jgi:hypothetical protein
MLPLPLVHLPSYLSAVFRFRDYQPQPVTLSSLTRWLSQLDTVQRWDVLALLPHIVYLSQKETTNRLVTLNQGLQDRLITEGITPANTIYVQMHDPASSSGVMLSILRDKAHLEKARAKFVDWKDIRGVNEITQRIGQGAIVYVDDFSATGGQFVRVRDHLVKYVVGAFAEFFLLPVICEEAFHRVSRLGVDVITSLVHAKAHRPLLQFSSAISSSKRDRLLQMCCEIDPAGGLGYGSLATMVIFYRNAPNTIPVLFRGSATHGFYGLFPRTSDIH